MGKRQGSSKTVPKNGAKEGLKIEKGRGRGGIRRWEQKRVELKSRYKGPIAKVPKNGKLTGDERGWQKVRQFYRRPVQERKGGIRSKYAVRIGF